MKVLFAPDWRAGNAYQELLANALAAEGVEVHFASHYHRVLPMTRGLARSGADMVHLHWPEAYYPLGFGLVDKFRLARFPFDFRLARRRIPFVSTAHNLIPHERPDGWAVRRNHGLAYRLSSAVFAHTQSTACELVSQYRVDPRRIVVVPHGDLTEQHGRPAPRAEARLHLGIPADRAVCLMIGAVREYKGIEEAVAYWKRHNPPAVLTVVGQPLDDAHRNQLTHLVAGHPGIDLRLQWVPDAEFGLWLGAADCVLFNYRRILTSGGASTVRAAGVPLLIPRRLNTVDLDEPHPLVFRFDTLETDFPTVLSRALHTLPDWDAAAAWRERTAWPSIAKTTAETYHRLLSLPAPSTQLQ